MRLLLVSNFPATESSPSGGIFIRSRAAALRKLGAEVDLATICPTSKPRVPGTPQPLPAPVGDADLETITVKYSLPQLGALTAGRFQSAVRKAAGEVRSKFPGPYDLVVGHGFFRPPAAGVAAELSQQWNVPFVAVAHGSDIRFLRRASRRYVQGVLDRAAACVFVSKELVRSGQSHRLRVQDPLVINNGFDDEVFRHQPDRAPGPLRLIYVGNLEEIKGADRLPELFARIAAREPRVALNIVGSGSLEKQLRMELPKSVEFSGRLDQKSVAEAMACADVLLMPSRSEGFPCVTGEAQAAGTAVVGTDVGGMSEAIGDAGTTITMEQGWNAENFADAVLRVSADFNREKVRQYSKALSWDQVAQRELELFQSVASCKAE